MPGLKGMQEMDVLKQMTNDGVRGMEVEFP